MMDTPCLILAGGFGTRLASIAGDRPKPMVEINGRPFLEYLVLQLRAQGFRDIVFCTGYRAQALEKHFEDGRRWSVSIRYSREPQPLGTGGALKLAASAVAAREYLVTNGDSILEADLASLVRFHREKRARATMALAQVPDAARYGGVETAPDRRVKRFAEKGQSGPATINGGIYVINREVLEGMPAGLSSIERDVFPSLDDLYARAFPGFFIDIGIPDDYLRLANHPEWLAGCLSPGMEGDGRLHVNTR